MAAPSKLAELERKATPKQRAMAKALATGGMTKVQAYRAVYAKESGTNPANQYRHASLAASHPKVSELTAAYLERVQYKPEQSVVEEPDKLRKFIVAGLQDLAHNSELDSVRLGAMVAMGKITDVGLFAEKSERSTDLIADHVQAELNDLLMELVKPETTIDVTPMHTSPD